jgi:ribosomal protein S3AE
MKKDKKVIVDVEVNNGLKKFTERKIMGETVKKKIKDIELGEFFEDYVEDQSGKKTKKNMQKINDIEDENGFRYIRSITV